MSNFFDDEPEEPEQNSFFSQTQPQRKRQQPIAGPSRARRQPVERDDSDPADELIVEEAQGSLLQRLATRWMNERNAPELLLDDPNGELNSCLQTLMLQQEAVNELRTDIANWDEVEHLQLLLVQQDNERIKWLANSLLRCRLAKVEQQHLLLLQNDKYRQRLSLEESQYLDRYATLFSNYMQTSVSNSLPPKQRAIDDQSNMSSSSCSLPPYVISTHSHFGQPVFEPDMDSAVYVLATKECGPIRLPDGKPLHLERGSIHMLRYRSIKELLQAGDVHLI